MKRNVIAKLLAEAMPVATLPLMVAEGLCAPPQHFQDDDAPGGGEGRIRG